MQEIWKDIPLMEEKYQVSNYGNVRSMYYNRRIKGKLKRFKKVNNFSLSTSDNGYSVVYLSKFLA